jgi:hypothetical protein
VTLSISRTDNLSQIGDWFDALARKIAREGLLSHLNLNIEIEYIFRDLLNKAYGWDLDNANDVFGKNQEAFDLSSRSGEVCVQVTTTQGAAKIRDSLKKFIPAHQDRFKRLVFMYPTMECSPSRADFSDQLNGYDFQPVRDRLCLGDLLKHAQQMIIHEQNDFLQLVGAELKPLGKALQLGAEPSVGLLIAVISHMANYGTPEQIAHHESRPDDARKLARFQKHAAFLKRQFTLNRECYIPVQQAREAVGIDAANTLRISLWLKTNSLDLLEKHGNDALTAFLELTRRLLDETHQSGRDADETAVRYLLADEFFRCNVFPNPDEI